MAITIYKKCTNCTARCCSDALSPVFITTADETRIGAANLSGKTISAFGNYVSRLDKRGDGKCIFYRDDISSHCSIYDDRPNNCRNYNVKECQLQELER